MNSDNAGSSQPRPPPTQSRQSPSRISHHSDYQQKHQHATSPPPGYPGRPFQPPPLQPLHTSPDRTSSYGSLQSPYQYNSASTISAQSHQAQSSHAPTPYATTPHESYPPGYNQPPQPQSAGVLASPYTPQPMSAGIHHQDQQSYFPHQRSQSIQSVASPYVPVSYSLQSRDSPHSGPSQPLRSQNFSPSAQSSLPGTPVRPPGGSQPHHSPPYGRPQSSGRDSHQDQSNMMSPNAQPRHSHQDARHMEQDPSNYPAGPQRERSESVSPKTVPPPGYRQESADHTEARGMKESSTMSISQACHGVPAPRPVPGTPHGNRSSPQPLPSDRVGAQDSKHPPSRMDVTPGSRPGSSPRLPQRKRRRYDEPPIYAQKSANAKGKGPVIPNRRPPVPKHMRHTLQGPGASRKRSISAQAPAPAPPRSQSDNVSPANGPPVANKPPEPPQLGALGPWEPSITGFIPHEEVTKVVCDFLFQHVVVREDVAAAPAGSSAPGQGAIIEVEGKLGHLIDVDRGDRLQLPLLTESIINRDHPRFRTSFESSMTLVRPRKPASYQI